MKTARFDSKKISLLVLGITAFACSRMPFAFFDDPEGPNLLIVIAFAAIAYIISLALYLSFPAKQNGFTKLFLAILMQILLAAGSYFCLK